jgi:hypothetical protein
MGKGQNNGRRPQKRAQPSWQRRTDEPDDFAPFASWDGDDFGRVYGDPDDEPEDTRRATVVIPAITLPTMPSVQRPPDLRHDDYDDHGDYEGYDDYDGYDEKPQRGLIRRAREPMPVEPPPAPTRQNRAIVPVSKKPKVPPGVDVVLVPGNESSRSGVRLTARHASRRFLGPLHVVRTHRKALTVFALAVIVIGVLVNTTGLLSTSGLAPGQWIALANFGGPAPTPTPPPAPDFTNPSHYVAKYGFDYPSNPLGIGSAEFNRLVTMLPFAYKATAAYDRRYHENIEPEMLAWWTHSEGIRGRINYSNCANYPPRAGYTYFSNIQNCPHASFWQLGYGNQFSVIYVLKNAFTDLYGNPNDTQLVQKVGQWVLNYDRSQGTVPTCGGYSCTFPARTIDSIMSGIDTTTGVQTADNWWASVLSRDPAINCYMIAHALTYFDHNATRNWIGCYYAEPCWGNESNRLGDILSAWPALRRAAHL